MAALPITRWLKVKASVYSRPVFIAKDTENDVYICHYTDLIFEKQ